MKEIGLYQFEYQITPEKYLNELFAYTENGVLFLSQQEPEEDLPRHYRCRMIWTEADLPALWEEFSCMVLNVFETVKEASADVDSVISSVSAAVQELIPEDGEVHIRAWRLYRLMELEAPIVIIQNEECKLMEALVLRRFCTVLDRITEAAC